MEQRPTTANIGLNLSSIISQVKQGQLLHALNAQVEGYDGNGVTYQNEQANVLCVNFPEGYKVIGSKNFMEISKHVYWLVNPDTGDSEIGTVDEGSCLYKTVINAKCLNFSIDFPIYKAVTKLTNCSQEIYWTDNRNPRRYIDLLNLPYAEDNSTCPPSQSSVVDCNKMNVQPNFSIPVASYRELRSSGSLLSGTYQFAVQYANSLGDGLTSYYTVTNPIPVFDPFKVTLEFDYPTTQSILLNIKELDTSGVYDYINVAVIKTLNNITTPFLVDTFKITGSSVDILYTGQDKTKLVIEDIITKFPIYEKAGDIFTVNDRLGWAILTTDERISYQSIASQVKTQWVTWKLPYSKGENYAKAIHAADRRGYMRDEPYALELVFMLTNGTQTDGFHIPGRVANSFDLELVAGDDVINPTNFVCDPPPESAPRWKVYNTGTNLGKDPLFDPDDDCYIGPYEYGEFAYWESTRNYPCDPEMWAELAGKPIRHHKFPDSLVTHIHDGESIYPIGIKIDPVQIKALIDASNLTQQQKDKIAGFKIVRGNRANNKSVIAKGMLTNVGKYTRDENTYFFSNYVFNDVRPDPFLSVSPTGADSGDNSGNRLNAFLDEPLRYTLHSPDTSFYQPFLGNVLKLETAEYGTSRSHFQEVEGHSKYKFLSGRSYGVAVAFGLVLALVPTGFVAGVSSGAFFSGAEGAITGFNLVIDLIQRLIPRKNFALQFNSVGDYTAFKPVPNSGNKQRSTDIAAYADPGMLSLSDTFPINNFQREKSVYLRTTKSLPFPQNIPDVPEDNSKWILSQEGCEDPRTIKNRSISSYYGSMKRDNPDQYGSMYSYETIDTGYYISIKEINELSGSRLSSIPQTPEIPSPPASRPPIPNNYVFGGDIFINKFAFKQKLPFFIDNRVGFPDDADVFYDEIGNIAYPVFWMSTDVRSDGGGSGFFNSIGQIFGVRVNNFDCDTTSRRFFYQDGKFYLFSYAIPYFFCESEVNVDMRQAYNNKEGDFYPHVGGDIPDYWLQEKNVSIAQDNTYTYNTTLSKQNKENFFSHIPEGFPLECFKFFPNRVIYSDRQQDVINHLRNNWVIYRPAAVFDFPLNHGKLVSVEGIEDRQVLARFENKSLIYNALLTAPTSAGSLYLGQNLFDPNIPPLDFAVTTLGWNGTQHKFFLSTEYGHISIDSKRGQIFLLNGRTATDITDSIQFNTGTFFTDNLEFEISNSFPEINTDNHFKGIGLHGVYDTKYNRIIITKLDYKLLDPTVTYSNGKFFKGQTEVFLTDAEFFCNRSFTASFDIDLKAWISFHTYLPNFYVGSHNVFFSGINGSPSSIWRHNTEFTRYNNFYNTIHPYIIEYPFAYQQQDEILQAVQDFTKVNKYLNQNDKVSFIQLSDAYFNKAIIYNDEQCTGVLKPIPKPTGNLYAYLQYPKFNTDSKEILYMRSDNFFNYNSFWNILRDQTQPIFLQSCQSLSQYKDLNTANLDYTRRSYKQDLIRGKDCRIRHILDNRDDIRLTSQFMITETQPSYK